MSNLPLATCLCMTYGRPTLLGEAVKCFIDQDYSNKQLLILNDQVGVELVLENCPSNITLINYPARFNSLGEKRNYLKGFGGSNGKDNFYCVWDDDDLYMPYRISQSVELMKNRGYDIVKARSAVMSVNNGQYKVVQNLFHSQACITNDYMSRTRYPDVSVGEDIAFETGARVGSFDIKPIYVYRWGLNIHHLSGIADQKQSWDRSLTFEPYTRLKGRIVIKPEFQKDYWKEIESLKIMKEFS